MKNKTNGYTNYPTKKRIRVLSESKSDFFPSGKVLNGTNTSFYYKPEEGNEAHPLTSETTSCDGIVSSDRPNKNDFYVLKIPNGYFVWIVNWLGIKLDYLISPSIIPLPLPTPIPVDQDKAPIVNKNLYPTWISYSKFLANKKDFEGWEELFKQAKLLQK